MSPKLNPKVGDRLKVILRNSKLFGLTVPVTRVEADKIWINANEGGELVHEMFCENRFLELTFAAIECQHEWKRLTMFRFDEFCCTKCPAKRPFDITKDAA